MKKRVCILTLLMIVSFASGITLDLITDNATESECVMKVESPLEAQTVFVSLAE